jgi:hypothetical protein
MGADRSIVAHMCSDRRVAGIGPRIDDDGWINRDIRDAMVYGVCCVK